MLMFQFGIELDRQAFAGVFRRPAVAGAGPAGRNKLIIFSIGRIQYNSMNS